jgi:hypothetical protein
MQWHKWVILIAGSMDLHYVLFAHPTFTSPPLTDAIWATVFAQLGYEGTGHPAIRNPAA